MGHSEAEISKHVRAYQIVLTTLVILTVVTVAASYVNFPVALGIGVALVIASIKGSMVGAVFMHLMGEQKMIFWVLSVTAIFFIGMIVLILGHRADHPHYDLGYETYLTPAAIKPAHAAHGAHEAEGHAEGH